MNLHSKRLLERNAAAMRALRGKIILTAGLECEPKVGEAAGGPGRRLRKARPNEDGLGWRLCIVEGRTVPGVQCMRDSEED